MDLELQNKLIETIKFLKQKSVEDIDPQQMDPIVKMMLVALLNETQKIDIHIKSLCDRIVERYCADFIPRQELEAVPAIALVQPKCSRNKDKTEAFAANDFVAIGSGHSFTYEYEVEGRKTQLSYIPLFNTNLLPYSDIIVMKQDNKYCKSVGISKPNRLWVGVRTSTEIQSIHGMTMFLRGTQGMAPEHIYIGDEKHQLDFVTAKEMELADMASPFDAQQSSGQFFSFLGVWKQSLLNIKDASLLYFTDNTDNRDLFKPRPFPESFKKWHEDSSLDSFNNAHSLWLCIDFPEGCRLPDNCEVLLNVIPVVNVEVCSLSLNKVTPIAKLQKNDGSFFLRILETTTSNHKQGFDMMNDEIIVRDFDASCYNDGDLYRDVRNLYNHFVDDYYAFIEYNDIKDGSVLKQLRETINTVGNSVRDPNKQFNGESGVYVMKNIRKVNPSSSVKVSYIVTQGRIGNAPVAGKTMDNKKLAAIERNVTIMVSASCGADKKSVDERHELLRYYTLTNDRLYTKMDIDAFLRKEIMAEFGKEEFKRIFVKISVEGAGGASRLRRGLYIDIDFKDKKNYEKALSLSFDSLMKQRIENKSCISMPIIVNLRNLEQ